MNEHVTRGEFRAGIERLSAEIERLSAELAQHAKAILEEMRVYIGVIDDKYKDVPQRLQKLEDAAPKPKRPRRAAR